MRNILPSKVNLNACFFLNFEKFVYFFKLMSEFSFHLIWFKEKLIEVGIERYFNFQS